MPTFTPPEWLLPAPPASQGYELFQMQGTVFGGQLVENPAFATRQSAQNVPRQVSAPVPLTIERSFGLYPSVIHGPGLAFVPS